MLAITSLAFSRLAPLAFSYFSASPATSFRQLLLLIAFLWLLWYSAAITIRHFALLLLIHIISFALLRLTSSLPFILRRYFHACLKSTLHSIHQRPIKSWSKISDYSLWRRIAALTAAGSLALIHCHYILLLHFRRFSRFWYCRFN